MLICERIEIIFQESSSDYRFQENSFYTLQVMDFKEVALTL
jgi:hypothetical protein